MTRVLVVRGLQATPWELRQWEQLPGRFDVSFLLTRRNRFDVAGVGLRAVRARSLADYLPRGFAGDLAATVAGDRYFGIEEELSRTEIVHAEELSYWFAADVARRKRTHGYRLVLTVWETLPLLNSFRNQHARRHRGRTLAEADLFVAASERARLALLLEGVPDERIVVSYPGVDVDRFSAAAVAAAPAEHCILSPGRLVWEKGHHDVIRAVAALRRGLVAAPSGAPRLLIVGSGPEETRLLAHARELGVADLVELRSAAYDEMPALFASASCMVLASLSNAGCALYPGDAPRCFWEEQFGMVLAEALAAGLPLVVSSSGAIPEVTGAAATYFTPGDWLGLARALADGPLARPPGKRVEHPPALASRFSTHAAAERLAAAYDRVLATARS